MTPSLQREIRRIRNIRRIGAGAFCFACGEIRPDTLFLRNGIITCYRCDRLRMGFPGVELHHPAGRANDPLVIAVDANDHRALNYMQLDHLEVFRNVTGDPLIQTSAKIRGLRDTSVYVPSDSLVQFIRDFMADTPAILEGLSRKLQTRLGPGWWKR